MVLVVIRMSSNTMEDSSRPMMEMEALPRSTSILCVNTIESCSRIKPRIRPFFRRNGTRRRQDMNNHLLISSKGRILMVSKSNWRNLVSIHLPHKGIPRADRVCSAHLRHHFCYPRISKQMIVTTDKTFGITRRADSSNS